MNEALIRRALDILYKQANKYKNLGDYDGYSDYIVAAYILQSAINGNERTVSLFDS